MPQDKIYAALGIKHVYFSNVDVEYLEKANFFHVVILPPSEPVKNHSEMQQFSVLGTF